MAESTAKSESRIERDLKSDVDSIRSDIDTLRKDLATVLDRIKGTATNRAEAEIQALQKRISKIADDVQTSSREGLRAVEERIEERPLVSLGIAFAIGLVIGRLFDRRSRPPVGCARSRCCSARCGSASSGWVWRSRCWRSLLRW